LVLVVGPEELASELAGVHGGAAARLTGGTVVPAGKWRKE
jgi:hypothetical protein